MVEIEEGDHASWWSNQFLGYRYCYYYLENKKIRKWRCEEPKKRDCDVILKKRYCKKEETPDLHLSRDYATSGFFKGKPQVFIQ